MQNAGKCIKRSVFFAATLCAALSVTPELRADPRTHDGFYFGATAGLGYLSTSADFAGSELSMSGVTLPSSLLLGGSIVPGLVLGGGFLTDYAPSPSMSINGEDVPSDRDVSLYLVGIGAFVDYYLDPHEGLHFQGLIGWGGLETSVEGDVGGSDPTGLVLALGAGHDWWVADEWSIGVMGRLAYAPLSLNDMSYTTIAPAVLASFTYH